MQSLPEFNKQKNISRIKELRRNPICFEEDRHPKFNFNKLVTVASDSTVCTFSPYPSLANKLRRLASIVLNLESSVLFVMETFRGSICVVLDNKRSGTGLWKILFSPNHSKF